jgi:hypothetical protein
MLHLVRKHQSPRRIRPSDHDPRHRSSRGSSPSTCNTQPLIADNAGRFALHYGPARLASPPAHHWHQSQLTTRVSRCTRRARACLLVPLATRGHEDGLHVQIEAAAERLHDLSPDGLLVVLLGRHHAVVEVAAAGEAPPQLLPRGEHREGLFPGEATDGQFEEAPGAGEDGVGDQHQVPRRRLVNCLGQHQVLRDVARQLRVRNGSEKGSLSRPLSNLIII